MLTKSAYLQTKASGLERYFLYPKKIGKTLLFKPKKINISGGKE